jgi:hypothetical protein
MQSGKSENKLNIEKLKKQEVSKQFVEMNSLWRASFLAANGAYLYKARNPWLDNAGKKYQLSITDFFGEVNDMIETLTPKEDSPKVFFGGDFSDSDNEDSVLVILLKKSASRDFAKAITSVYNRTQEMINLESFFDEYPDILNYISMQFDQNPLLIEAGKDFESFKKSVIDTFIKTKKIWCTALDCYLDKNYLKQTKLELWLDGPGKKYQNLIHSFGEDVHKILANFNAVEKFTFAFTAPFSGLVAGKIDKLNIFFEKYPDILCYLDEQFKKNPIFIQAGIDFGNFVPPALKTGLYPQWEKIHEKKLEIKVNEIHPFAGRAREIVVGVANWELSFWEDLKNSKEFQLQSMEVEQNPTVEFYTKDSIHTLSEEEYNSIYKKAKEVSEAKEAKKVKKAKIWSEEMPEHSPIQISAVLKLAIYDYLLALNQFHAEIWNKSGPKNRSSEKDWQSWGDFGPHFFKPIEKMRDEFQKTFDFKKLSLHKLDLVTKYLLAELFQFRQQVSFSVDNHKNCLKDFSDHYLKELNKAPKPR